MADLVVMPVDNVVVVDGGASVAMVVSAGPQGSRGATGSAGAGIVHLQTSPSTSWDIVHNLGRSVGVEVWIAGDQVEADVMESVDLNTVHVTFGSAQTGKAVLL